MSVNCQILLLCPWNTCSDRRQAPPIQPDQLQTLEHAHIEQMTLLKHQSYIFAAICLRNIALNAQALKSCTCSRLADTKIRCKHMCFMSRSGTLSTGAWWSSHRPGHILHKNSFVWQTKIYLTVFCRGLVDGLVYLQPGQIVHLPIKAKAVLSKEVQDESIESALVPKEVLGFAYLALLGLPLFPCMRDQTR